MANGANNVEDTDMAECDGEKVVTMMDVLQEQQDFEDDANAVLGASDEKNCTYSKGYIKRQALYACLTCCSEVKDDPTKRAGVCLACSLNCHENHELIELYTKRNFRCDCGNPKFNSHPCQFTPDKSDLNNDNKYNQNFSGLYCNCHRPYPDPESTVEDDEMIQCIICEDWLHASHLDAVVPGNDQYSEMICKACMESNEFLHDYNNLSVNVDIGDVDVTFVNDTETKLSNGDLEVEKLMNGTGNSSKQSTEEPEYNLDVVKNDVVQTHEPQELEKPVEHNNANESDVPIEAEKTEAPSQISFDVNSDSKDDTNIAIISDDSTKANEDILEGKRSVDTGSTQSQEPKETEEKEQTMPESEDLGKNTDNITENSEATEGQTTDVTAGEGNEEEPAKLDSKDTDQNNVIETAKNDNLSNSKDSDEHNVIKRTTDNSVDTKTNDIDVHDAKAAETENSDVAKVEDSTTKTDSTLTDIISAEIASEEEINDGVSEVESNEKVNCTEEVTDVKENKRKLSTEDITNDNLAKKPKLAEENKCTRPKNMKRVHKGASFWSSNFRQKLCTCNECLSMYKDLSVLFLLDPEDTVIAYETLGKKMVDGRATQYEKGLEALSSLDRIQQINALTEYNKMKDKLLDFLKSFKDRKEIVKEEDIKAFFAGMKPKREPDGVYFCR